MDKAMGGVFHACHSGTGEVEMGGSGGWEVHWPASLTYLVIPRPMKDNVSKTKQQPQDSPTHPPPTKKKKRKKTATAYHLGTMWPLHSLESLQQLWFLHKAHTGRSQHARSVRIHRTQRVTKQKPLPTKQRNQKTKQNTPTQRRPKKTWSRKRDMMGCTCRKWKWGAGGGSTKNIIHML